MRRKTRRAADLLTSTMEAQAAVMTVLGIRVPALLDGSASAAERTRMVQEKAEAVAESAQAVGRAATRMMSRPKRRATPQGLMTGWLALAEAASQPFHRRVKANAKRLSRKRKTRSS